MTWNFLIRTSVNDIDNNVNNLYSILYIVLETKELYVRL